MEVKVTSIKTGGGGGSLRNNRNIKEMRSIHASFGMCQVFKLPIFAMRLGLNVNIYDFRAVHEKKYVGHTYLHVI